MKLLQFSSVNLNEVILLVLLSLVAVWLGNALLVLIVGIIILLFWQLEFWSIKNKYNWIVLIISNYLLITSDIAEEIRLAVNILNVIILIYLVVDKFGLDSSSYPKLPLPIFLLIVTTMFSMLLSTIFSSNFYESFVQCVRQGLFFIIIYFFYSLLESEKDIKYFFKAIIISASILALIIIITFIQSENLFYLLLAQGSVIDAGYLNNQAAAGGLFAVSIPLLLSIIFSKGLIDVKYNKYLIIIYILQFFGLLLSNSRAAIFAAVISSLIIVFILKRKLFLQIVNYIIFLTVGIVLTIPSVVDAISIFFRLNRVAENTRYYIWDMALDIIKTHPIVGVGPGQFYNHMYNNLPVLIGSWEEKQLRWLYDMIGSGYGIGHNYLIHRFTELGMVGMIPTFYLPILFLFSGYNLIKKSTDHKYFPIVVGIVGSGIGLFFRSFYEATGLLSYGWITRDLPFWLLLLSLFFIQRYFDSNSEIHQSLNKRL